MQLARRTGVRRHGGRPRTGVREHAGRESDVFRGAIISPQRGELLALLLRLLPRSRLLVNAGLLERRAFHVLTAFSAILLKACQGLL